MSSETSTILLELDILSKCLTIVSKKWTELVKPLLGNQRAQPNTCDSADVLSAMISQFLVDNHFEKYLADNKNYQLLCNHIKSHTNQS